MSDLILKDEKIVQSILEAARILFSRYGLKKTTMDDVGKAVGKGKSTLYYYFPGKTELFEAVVLDELKNLIRNIRLAINAETTSTGKLKAFLLTRLKLKEKLQNLSQVVYDDIFDNYKEICRLKTEFESTQVEIIREIVSGGIQAGEFREMPADEVGFFSKWTAAAFRGLELPVSTSPIMFADQDSCDKIVDFILSGIGKEGRK
jgi:AcrR family transcriptional regulator